jgi:uncharacterized tellurite resistance protein B-like protein
MLVKIKQFFKEHLEITDAENPESTEQAVQLACAALLIEVSKADFTLDSRETEAMVELVQQLFSLDPADVDKLIKLAQEETDQAPSLYQFTRLVNDFYGYDQKLQLLSAMWQVAYADDNLDKYEEHLIRKVAELIYVTHNDFIRLKVSAQASLSKTS